MMITEITLIETWTCYAWFSQKLEQFSSCWKRKYRLFTAKKLISFKYCPDNFNKIINFYLQKRSKNDEKSRKKYAVRLKLRDITILKPPKFPREIAKNEPIKRTYTYIRRVRANSATRKQRSAQHTASRLFHPSLLAYVTHSEGTRKIYLFSGARGIVKSRKKSTPFTSPPLPRAIEPSRDARARIFFGV